MTTLHAHAPVTRLEDLAWLVQSEFAEMPGMRLTFAQAKRLWNLSHADCDSVLHYLVSAGQLTRDEHDRFGRSGH